MENERAARIPAQGRAEASEDGPLGRAWRELKRQQTVRLDFHVMGHQANPDLVWLDGFLDLRALAEAIDVQPKAIPGLVALADPGLAFDMPGPVTRDLLRRIHDLYRALVLAGEITVYGHGHPLADQLTIDAAQALIRHARVNYEIDGGARAEDQRITIALPNRGRL